MKLDSLHHTISADKRIIWYYAPQICCNFVAKSKIKSRKTLILLDYSMIVATLPEPTVLPPSRYMNSVFRYIFYAFYD
jgi:hypothetical protein